MRYYLAIGVTDTQFLGGGLASGPFAGWFALDSYSVQTAPTLAGATSAGLTGLTVLLGEGAQTAASTLFSAATVGGQLNQVRLVGVDDSRAGSPQVMEIRLDKVLASGFETGPGGLSLSFEAQRYTVRDWSPDATGALTATQDFAVTAVGTVTPGALAG